MKRPGETTLRVFGVPQIQVCRLCRGMSGDDADVDWFYTGVYLSGSGGQCLGRLLHGVFVGAELVQVILARLDEPQSNQGSSCGLSRKRL